MKLAALTALYLAAACAHAQTKPAQQVTRQDMQVAMERELHVIDAAAVATCSALRPDLAGEIGKAWQQNLASLPPDLIAYRKTDAFAKAVAGYQQEQAADAKKPENQQTLHALCKSMAGQ